jgi:glycosyltransferase involved in cell wall biosynthesis
MISKIVICTINLTTNLNQVNGGVDSAIINLLDGLSKFPKKSIYVISFTKAKSKIVRYKSNIILIYINFNFFKSSKLSFVCKAPFLFRKLINKIQPDIIHYQLHGIFLIIRLFLKKHKFQELNTFHGIYHLEAKINKGNKLEARINNLMNKFFLTKNAIFISKFSAKSLINYKFNKSAIIPNSISPKFNVNSTFDSDNLELLFVGLISPLKNLELIIESLRLLKNNFNVKLYVYGSFKSPTYEKLILEKIEIYKLQDQIVFKGFISQNELLSVLNNNNIVTVPSLHENLPMVIAESLMMNNIVIASKVGGIPEMIENNKSGFLIDPYAPKELSILLTDILTNKYDLKQIARNGKEFAINNFLSEYIAHRSIKFYESLL